MDPTTPSRDSARAAATRADWQRLDPDARRKRTAAARAAWRRRFEDQVDPDQVLPDGRRALLAEGVMRAFMTELARRQARRPRPGGTR